MTIPHLLTPASIEDITLPSGTTVQVPKATPRLQPWEGEAPTDSFGGKALLDYDGKIAFAELVILRCLQQVGWQGVWVDTYSKRFRTEFWPKDEVTLPARQQHLLDTIYHLSGSTRGCWDVFCWHGDMVLFAESKRRSRDRMRDSQRQWLQSALTCGLPLSSFLIVEWSL